MLSLIIFILVLSLLVFVHELGHFLAAKLTGMRVDEFAIGFPPRLLGVRKGETTYALNALPLGGYVKIFGEASHNEEHDPRSFSGRPVWARIVVVLAGVTMNILFAFLVLCVAFSFRFPTLGLDIASIPGATVTKNQTIVTDILADSPAAKAGLQAGDQITALADASGISTPVTSLSALQDYTKVRQESGELNLQVTVGRDNAEVTSPLTINASGPALGVAAEDATEVRVPFWRAPQAAWMMMTHIASVTWQALSGFIGELFSQAKLAEDVSGPVGIYRVTAEASQQGVVALTFLTVALSVNLALLNILPFPALDGGKLVFLIIELVFRKRIVSERIENTISTIGFALLIGLIAVLTLKDFGLF